MRYEKGSFIVVPQQSSIIGIGVGPQALYMWLCYHANQSGSCFPSRKTLAEKMGCSERSVNTYLDELINIGLIKKEARYNNGEQLSNNYYLPIGVAESAIPLANPAIPPLQTLQTELNPFLTQSNNGETKFRIESDNPKDTPKRERKDTTYLRVFELWGKYPLNWKRNLTQIESAKNILLERDMVEAKEIVEYYQKHKKERFIPRIMSPVDLDRKWEIFDNWFDKKKQND